MFGKYGMNKNMSFRISIIAFAGGRKERGRGTSDKKGQNTKTDENRM